MTLYNKSAPHWPLYKIDLRDETETHYCGPVVEYPVTSMKAFDVSGVYMWPKSIHFVADDGADLPQRPTDFIRS